MAKHRGKHKKGHRKHRQTKKQKAASLRNLPLANPAWHKHKLAEAKRTFTAHVKAGYCSAMQGARFCWGSPGHRGEHHFRYNDPMFD